jgi:hypothetical protein
VAELLIRKDSWLCHVGHSDNYVHIGFAWAISKVYMVMRAEGKRKK